MRLYEEGILHIASWMIWSKVQRREHMASSDTINAINWQLKTPDNEVFEYVKNLIQLRRAHPAFRLGNADMIRKNIEYLPTDPNVVAIYIKNHDVCDKCLHNLSYLDTAKSCRRY